MRGLLIAPVKRVLRKLMRWYVEPVAAHQRTFNIAMLRSSTSSPNGPRTISRVSSVVSKHSKSVSSLSGPKQTHENAVCAPQVPLERGGTGSSWDVVDQLRERDHEVELVILFKWYPGPRPLREALVWRLLDLEEVQGRSIDLLLATKFPSYAIRHSNKVVWLVHQFRQAYASTEPSSGSMARIRSTARRCTPCRRLDQKTLGEARRLRNLQERR